jgi:hypothetical protein
MDLLKQLKDIKPNVQIIDYQFYIFIAVSLIGVLLIFYMLLRFLRKKEPNPYLLKLKNLDFGDSKKTAYRFSEYAKHFVNEENRVFYDEIVKELEKYKYRPVVDDLDKETVRKIKKFIEDIK